MTKPLPEIGSFWIWESRSGGAWEVYKILQNTNMLIIFFVVCGSTAEFADRVGEQLSAGQAPWDDYCRQGLLRKVSEEDLSLYILGRI